MFSTYRFRQISIFDTRYLRQHLGWNIKINTTFIRSGNIHNVQGVVDKVNMAVPDHVEEQSLALDKENNRIVIRCSECNEYDGEVQGDDYDEAEDAFNQARRMLGSHWSAKHKEGGQGDSTSETPPSQGNQPSPSAQGGNGHQQSPANANAKNSQPNSQNQGNDYSEGVNERELIYRKGEEGLLELKTERLKDWLQDAGGAGGQTESRILKVFQRNKSVHSNPYSLYNLLEEETTASGSYINTIVDDVFEPEREHEDVLENTGYTPFFRRSGQGGQFGNQQQGGPSMGGGRGGGQQYGQSAAQGRGRGGGMQQQQGQQGQQPQQQDSSEDLSKREVAQMISQGINTAQEENEENPFRDGLSEATDEAVREMASNVGGLAGTANRVFEEALMSYAQDNPEFIIENMDFLQKALGAAQGPEDEGNKGQPQQPESTQKVDNALSQIGDGGQTQQPQNLEPDIPQQNRQQAQQPQQTQPRQQSQKPTQNPQPNQQQPTQQSPPEPETNANVGHDVGPDDSGFEPGASDESNMTGQHPPLDDEEPPTDMPTPEGGKEEQSQEDTTDVKNSDEQPSTDEDGFDEIFGDMAD